ncbi:MAG: hypothetical protein KF678_06535 [Phycisphaeraceae bacterium]|nr:hypothetical protein [Phycisphaeraceae bacterium]
MRTAIAAWIVLGLVPALVGAQPAGGQSVPLPKMDIQSLSLPQSQPAEPFEVSIHLEGAPRTIRLEPFSIRGPHFRLLVQREDGSLHPQPAGPEVTYRGRVVGDESSIVAATLTDRGLTGIVRRGRDQPTWSVQPLADVVPGADRRMHVVLSERDVVGGPWRCGVPDGPKAPSGRPVTGGPDAFLVCQLSVDADYEYYLANGSSVPNTTADISAVVNGMGAIYQADANVTFELGTVVVRQSASQPYTSTSANTLLTQFVNEWVANQSGTVRDLAHLFTGKDLDGSTIGLAYVGVVCNSSFGYGLSQSRFTTNFANRVGVTAHEVGHNFAENHCDSTCSPCRIMCATIGGCSGVSSLGCSASTLATYAAGRPCLSPLNNGLTLPFSETFPSLTLDYNRWPTPANNGGAVSAAAVNERSAPYSLNLSNAASITCAGIDLTGVGGRRVFVNFWTQHQNVEAGETLLVSYRRPVQGDFVTLTTITSNGSNQTQFWPTEVVLPVDGHGANAAIRFTAQGNQSDDAWYIDDVKVSLYCRADLNQDWALNIFDFQAFQASLATLSTSICDWNGDGFITVLDYSAFFNAVNAGCTGY